MNPARERHLKYNRATADRWRDFEGHRERVMTLLRSEAGTQTSLCVLGAGNCNDLDLAELSRSFGAVHLYDIDAPAMQQAVQRQDVAAAKLALHARDLGGFYEALDAGADASGVLEAINSFALPPETGTYDVVISLCLLSQLKHSLFGRFGADEAAFTELCDAVRRRHFACVQALIAPGGRGLLATDFTSSDLYPPLSTCSDADFAATVAEALAQGRCFHRNAPELLEADLRTTAAVEDLEALPHWRWMIWPTHFAVCGFRWRRVRH